MGGACSCAMRRIDKFNVIGGSNGVIKSDLPLNAVLVKISFCALNDQSGLLRKKIAGGARMRLGRSSRPWSNFGTVFQGDHVAVGQHGGFCPCRCEGRERLCSV